MLIVIDIAAVAAGAYGMFLSFRKRRGPANLLFAVMFAGLGVSFLLTHSPWWIVAFEFFVAALCLLIGMLTPSR